MISNIKLKDGSFIAGSIVQWLLMATFTMEINGEAHAGKVISIEIPAKNSGFMEKHIIVDLQVTAMKEGKNMIVRVMIDINGKIHLHPEQPEK